MDNFTLGSKGKEKWFTGYSDEKGQTYLGVLLAPSRDGLQKRFRAKVSLDYPYGILMTEDQAKSIKLDMKHFSWVPDFWTGIDGPRRCRDSSRRMVCSILVSNEKNPIPSEFSSALRNVEIKEKQEDDDPNDIIIGGLGLERLALLSDKTSQLTPKFSGFHSSIAVGKFKPSVQPKVQKFETSDFDEAPIKNNF